MKKILLLLPLLILMVTACGKHHKAFTKGYDSDICAELSQRIERRDSLTQDDYAMMIAQNEAILQYLIDRTAEISDLPDSCRYSAWRSLTAEPEYLERFGYMFTIGSALYQADLYGKLDQENTDEYNSLDEYNTKLADYTDRF